jgi:hypothetical protein
MHSFSISVKKSDSTKGNRIDLVQKVSYFSLKDGDFGERLMKAADSDVFAIKRGKDSSC